MQFWRALSGRLYATANRPLSPHLTIYQPQLTWLMSIGHRLTGSALAGAIYVFGIASAVSPRDLFPYRELLRFSSSPSLPEPAYHASKFVLALPFTFHLFNGVRHLIWDAGWALTLRGVYATGWLVNAASIASSAYLTVK